MTKINRKKIWILGGIGLVFSVFMVAMLLQVERGSYYDDFFARWYATKQLFVNGRSLYDQQNALEVSEWIVHPINDIGFYYPAYILIFIGPLSWLPYPIARAIWTICGMWIIWLSTVLISRLPRQSLSLNQTTAILIGATISFPFFQHTIFSQFNAIGVLALGLTYWALVRKYYFWAGIFMAGLLFKPQATLIPLAFISLWSIWRRERWGLPIGFLVASFVLMGFAEWIEPNWLSHFFTALTSYPAIKSPMMELGDRNRWISGILVLLTSWLVWRIKESKPENWSFRAGLLWALSINSLIMPLVGIFHMVFLAPMLVLLLCLVKERTPHKFKIAWIFTILIFVIGLFGLFSPLFLFWVSDAQIIISEAIYRIFVPVAIAGTVLLFLMTPNQKPENLEPEAY